MGGIRDSVRRYTNTALLHVFKPEANSSLLTGKPHSFWVLTWHSHNLFVPHWLLLTCVHTCTITNSTNGIAFGKLIILRHPSSSWVVLTNEPGRFPVAFATDSSFFFCLVHNIWWLEKRWIAFNIAKKYVACSHLNSKLFLLICWKYWHLMSNHARLCIPAFKRRSESKFTSHPMTHQRKSECTFFFLKKTMREAFLTAKDLLHPISPATQLTSLTSKCQLKSCLIGDKSYMRRGTILYSYLGLYLPYIASSSEALLLRWKLWICSKNSNRGLYVLKRVYSAARE